MAQKIKKGDRVVVLAGKDKGKTGEISRVLPAAGKAVVDGINIKLMKCGGLVDGVRMAVEAKKRGLLTMIGCMMESSLALTAAAHISPLVDYADLDSGLLLSKDPFVGVRITEGRMTLPEEPGLGVRRAQ